jgi:hypothetical protein
MQRQVIIAPHRGRAGRLSAGAAQQDGALPTRHVQQPRILSPATSASQDPSWESSTSARRYKPRALQQLVAEPGQDAVVTPGFEGVPQPVDPFSFAVAVESADQVLLSAHDRR